jgi:hypothetical protein
MKAMRYHSYGDSGVLVYEDADRPVAGPGQVTVKVADDDVAKQISALEDARYQAMTDGDVAALADLLAADLVYTHSDATLTA